MVNKALTRSLVEASLITPSVAAALLLLESKGTKLTARETNRLCILRTEYLAAENKYARLLWGVEKK